MCNRYVSPDQAAIERFWHIGGRNPPRWWAPEVYPRAQGPFIRAADEVPEAKSFISARATE